MRFGGARRIGGLIVVALLAAPACTKSAPALPSAEVGQFLAAWSKFDTAAMAGLVQGAPPELAALVTGMKDDLDITAARFTAGKVAFGKAKTEADAQFTASLDLAGLGPWEYAGAFHLVKTAKVWRIAWSPAVVHPVLEAGQHFDRTRAWPARAPILGANDTPLAAMGDVVQVGLAPARIKDRTQVDAALGQQLGVEPGAITAALNAPGVQPEHFVPIGLPVPGDRFVAMRSILEPIPGVFFQRGSGRLSPSDGFAAHVLGRVGEITAERLADLGSPYVVGDQVGLSGLEAAYEKQLAGAPSGDVRIVAGDGTPVRTVFHFDGVAPKPVRITIDAATQAAAEQALVGVAQSAALVAVDAATGDVRAVVSRPLTEEFDRALAGQYPPGSTFKVVTAAALLANGVQVEAPVTCPTQATVGGQTFVNFEGETLGAITFRTAFAHSCNTAFVGLVANVPTDTLTATAATFGFGKPYPQFMLPVAGANFPAPKDAAEKASAAIGQGSVVASPLHMATVAAAVAGGAWHPPRLLADQPAGPPEPALAAGVATSLRDLMGEVVRSGTGAAAAVPGQQIAGKTGTAEIGADPNQTHAWFVGFRGTLAFAVLVEKGGVGGRVAAPIAAKFLAGLAP